MKEWERGGGQLIRQLDIVSYHAICNQCQWNIVDWLFLYIFIQSNKWVKKRFKLPPLSSSSPHSQCIVQLFTWARHIWRQSIRSKIKCTPSHHYHQHRRCCRRCHQNHHHPFNDAAAVEHRQHISSPCITEPPDQRMHLGYVIALVNVTFFSGSNSLILYASCTTSQYSSALHREHFTHMSYLHKTFFVHSSTLWYDLRKCTIPFALQHETMK